MEFTLNVVIHPSKELSALLLAILGNGVSNPIVSAPAAYPEESEDKKAPGKKIPAPKAVKQVPAEEKAAVVEDAPAEENTPDEADEETQQLKESAALDPATALKNTSAISLETLKVFCVQRSREGKHEEVGKAVKAIAKDLANVPKGRYQELYNTVAAL